MQAELTYVLSCARFEGYVNRLKVLFALFYFLGKKEIKKMVFERTLVFFRTIFFFFVILETRI